MKKLVLGLLLTTSVISSQGYADTSSSNLVTGVGYVGVTDDSDGQTLTVGAVVGSLGYRVKVATNTYIIPEFRIGVGVVDDTIDYFGLDIDVELDRFVSLGVKVQHETEGGFYFFVEPSYTNIELTASASRNGVSASSSEDEWDFGVGAGVGLNFTETTGLEFSYETFDGADVIGVSLKFKH